MAVVLRLPDRSPAIPDEAPAPVREPSQTAEIHILPCVRREYLDGRSTTGR
ncbi:hypothetical protein [Mangrovibrevibacter kandeliae]|uniref:hypothetical protein n=1 Tax=Mangrovibrevibacter kandeliae TaxID=2968473 RepID=UPI002118ADB9|nr:MULTISPECIES: hypothetical protein [unclassified Aurantimonas]MCQ8781068.1 hypothetical protein [Aurantimonas sp. CSK15Z-1]MCW4113849.1 hypothetical protein [Aurantimonas sp. MSK8Z-1]